MIEYLPSRLETQGPIRSTTKTNEQNHSYLCGGHASGLSRASPFDGSVDISKFSVPAVWIIGRCLFGELTSPRVTQVTCSGCVLPREDLVCLHVMQLNFISFFSIPIFHPPHWLRSSLDTLGLELRGSGPHQGEAEFLTWVPPGMPSWICLPKCVRVLSAWADQALFLFSRGVTQGPCTSLAALRAPCSVVPKL